ncbi:uncharacterized protein DUF1850 [Rhodobacter sp. JA431]|uniref:DUF1850 domain-containing protein n=1 Tax=Rhodobacter sp. JA431 TaxID=570013 RepID=UPI000BD7AB23|nr:DUF1850 domain-containing protein [Rhodobacter sp. JA431]SOC04285.1 uncharacterized protein DUF1850 [Rhodobacter sp. JA431]
MSACLIAGALVVALGAEGRFALEWTHSVEKQVWREEWQVQGAQMHLRRAAVKGSGAGMEPGPGGWFEAGWWVWEPDTPPVSALHLAASGATGSGWRLCTGAQSCWPLGETPGAALDLRPCAE